MAILARLRRMFARDDGAPERLPSPDALVPAARVPGEPEALMLQELLRNGGVHALVRNSGALSMPHAIGGSWGAWEVVVMRKDLRRARDLLGDDDSGA
jgi:hypothetical protein